MISSRTNSRIHSNFFSNSGSVEKFQLIRYLLHKARSRCKVHRFYRALAKVGTSPSDPPAQVAGGCCAEFLMNMSRLCGTTLLFSRAYPRTRDYIIGGVISTLPRLFPVGTPAGLALV